MVSVLLMPYKLSIEILGLPKTVNQLGRSHWAVKIKHNKQWEALIYAAVHSEGQGLPYMPLKKAMVILTRISAKEPDFDNLVNSFKCCLDSLIKRGVLENDNSKVIGHPTYVWEKCKKGEGKIRIEVIGDGED